MRSRRSAPGQAPGPAVAGGGGAHLEGQKVGAQLVQQAGETRLALGVAVHRPDQQQPARGPHSALRRRTVAGGRQRLEDIADMLGAAGFEFQSHLARPSGTAARRRSWLTWRMLAPRRASRAARLARAPGMSCSSTRTLRKRPSASMPRSTTRARVWTSRLPPERTQTVLPGAAGGGRKERRQGHRAGPLDDQLRLLQQADDGLGGLLSSTVTRSSTSSAMSGKVSSPRR